MIRKRFPDKPKARSMIAAAELDMEFIDSLPITTKASQSIVRSIYENFRILGDALLTAKGFETSGTDHHTQMMEALIKLDIKTTRPLLLLNDLKRIRHQINYNGYVPTENEVKYVLEIKETFWKPILAEVKRQIES